MEGDGGEGEREGEEGEEEEEEEGWERTDCMERGEACRGAMQSAMLLAMKHQQMKEAKCQRHFNRLLTVNRLFHHHLHNNRQLLRNPINSPFHLLTLHQQTILQLLLLLQMNNHLK